MSPLFRSHDLGQLTVAELPDGVHVVHTAPDPDVHLLIRQHAYRAVNEVVAYGMERAMEPTPLPEADDGEQDRSSSIS